MSATGPPTWLKHHSSAWTKSGCWASRVTARLARVGGAGLDSNADQGHQHGDVAFTGQMDTHPVIARLCVDLAVGAEGLAHPVDDRPGQVDLCLIGVVEVDDVAGVGCQTFAGDTSGP